MKALRYFVVLLLLSVSLISFGREKKPDPSFIKEFELIYNDIHSPDYRIMHKLDSLEYIIMGEDEEEIYKPYLNLIYACIAYEKGDNDVVFDKCTSSLEYFILEENNEWAARCFLLLGYTADNLQHFVEASHYFNKVLEYSQDARLLGGAHIGLAKVKKLLHLDWKESYDKGVAYYNETGNRHLMLNIAVLDYWFDNQKEDLVKSLTVLAEERRLMRKFVSESAIYHVIAKHYFNTYEYDSALYYTNINLEVLGKVELEPYISLAQAHYFKGMIMFELGDIDSGKEELNTALILYKKTRAKELSYNIYRYLYNYEKEVGNYVLACEYMEDVMLSFRSRSQSRLSSYKQMLKIQHEVKIIEDDLKVLKRRANIKTVALSLFIFLVSLGIILWLRARKLFYEKKSELMESSNKRLKAETGKLLIKANKNKRANEILESQQVIESKVDKLMSDDEGMPAELKERYAEVFLLFESKLKELSETERRYAVMIALDVPYKTIAKIQNVQPGTVAQYRNRIRKKLGIANTKVELETHLKSFLKAE